MDTTDKTTELIKKAQAGDRQAAEQLVRENSGLIWSVVKRFVQRGYEAEDLYQIGAIGLIKCIQKFDLSYDVKFSTYAVPMIMGEIKRFLRDDGIIKVSRPLKEMAIKAKYAQEAYISRCGKQPTVSELATEMGVNVEDLVMAMESGFEVESLYATIHSGDGTPIYLIDKLDRDENDVGVIDSIALKQIIGKLKPKERQIIMLRYYYDKTQMEIAKTMGVSQVQVSRLEKKILRTIRESYSM